MMVVDVEGVVGWWLTDVSQWWGRQRKVVVRGHALVGKTNTYK
jgi:hypothetical protein